MGKRAFYIKTLGCKVNQYESQVIRERFLRDGYSEADSIDNADICIVNTCTVTLTSDSKSLRLINTIKGKNKCVVMTGCMVEDRDLDLSKLKGVNFIIANKDKYIIPQIINWGSWIGCRVSSDPRSPLPVNCSPISGLKGHTRVFVKVQDGCDNLCSYCKVRIVRGRSRSRALKEILEECKILIRNGTKEIVLTGICLGAYGRDLPEKTDISKLIKKICNINGEWRLRLSSIEPKDINEDLIAEFRSQKKLCKHLHIPFQSGDSYILRRMNRPYTRDAYLNIIHRLREFIPDIAISTDIIVGFPGETETRFQNTFTFLKAVRPMRMHIFPFSKRKGTKAYSYKDNNGNAVKKERENKLVGLAKELSIEFIDRFVDREVEVLVEAKKTNEGYFQGYTDRYIKVYTHDKEVLKGQLVKGQLMLLKDIENNSTTFKPFLVGNY